MAFIGHPIAARNPRQQLLPPRHGGLRVAQPALLRHRRHKFQPAERPMAKTQGTLSARGNDVIGKIAKPRWIAISALIRRRQRHQRNPEKPATPSQPGMIVGLGSSTHRSRPRAMIDCIEVKAHQRCRGLSAGPIAFELRPSRQRNTDAGPAVGDTGIRDGGKF